MVIAPSSKASFKYEMPEKTESSFQGIFVTEFFLSAIQKEESSFLSVLFKRKDDPNHVRATSSCYKKLMKLIFGLEQHI